MEVKFLNNIPLNTTDPASIFSARTHSFAQYLNLVLETCISPTVGKLHCGQAAPMRRLGFGVQCREPMKTTAGGGYVGGQRK